MKRMICLGLLMVTVNPIASMSTTTTTPATTITPATATAAIDGLSNLLQTLGVSPNQSVTTVVTLASLLATIYTLGHTVYTQYLAYSTSTGPNAETLNQFIQDTTQTSVTQLGIVTYADLNASIQEYLTSQGYGFTQAQIEQIAQNVAQQVVDTAISELPAPVATSVPVVVISTSSTSADSAQ